MKTTTVKKAVGKVMFVADLPAHESEGFPGKLMVSAIDVQRFEMAIARWVIDNGTDGPDSVKALRAAAGLTGSQLAELLGIDRARISEWENGHAHPGRAMFATIARLALDSMQGKTETADYLRLMGSHREQKEEIKLAVG